MRVSCPFLRLRKVGTLLIFPVGQLSDQLAKEYARSPRAMRAVRGLCAQSVGNRTSKESPGFSCCKRRVPGGFDAKRHPCCEVDSHSQFAVNEWNTRARSASVPRPQGMEKVCTRRRPLLWTRSRAVGGTCAP